MNVRVVPPLSDDDWAPSDDDAPDAPPPKKTDVAAVRLSKVVRIPQVIARLHAAGKRVPLGFAPLDNCSKGGVFVDWRIFVGGGPGTGKTTLCAQLAKEKLEAGWCVRWFAVDEGPEEVLARWLQLDGIPQDEAEDLRSARSQQAARRLMSLDIGFIEEPLIDCDVEWTDGNLNRLVVIDSLQQVAVAGCETLEPRARIDASLKSIKRIFSANSVLSLVTTELARGAYRNQSSQDATDPIAAAKESGGIEYHASMLVVMRSVKDEPDLVNVAVPKVRRGGRKDEFLLKLNREECRFSFAGSGEDAQSIAHNKALDELATRALGHLRKIHPSKVNQEELRGELACKAPNLRAALGRLFRAGAAEFESGPRNAKLWGAVVRSVET